MLAPNRKLGREWIDARYVPEYRPHSCTPQVVSRAGRNRGSLDGVVARTADDRCKGRTGRQALRSDCAGFGRFIGSSVFHEPRSAGPGLATRRHRFGQRDLGDEFAGDGHGKSIHSGRAVVQAHLRDRGVQPIINCGRKSRSPRSTCPASERSCVSSGRPLSGARIHGLRSMN